MTEPHLPPADAPPAGRRGVWLVGIIIMVLVLAVIIVLTRGRNRTLTAETTARATTVTAGPLVKVDTASAAAATREVVVQGEAEPWASVTLYAKVSGYLKRITVDKGDPVHQGEVLAEIESPETDQALLAAQADATAKQELAQRDHQLLARKFVATEEVESADAAAQIAKAKAAGLQMEKGYELLTAPFDGTVTARYADPGALMQSAATSQTSALPVVTVADVSHLRVRIYLDQQAASLARRGTPAVIRLTERPDFALHATIARLTEELDPKTRTLLAELDVDNRQHEILAGSFVEVHLMLPTTAKVTVPAEALITQGDKQYVARVDSTSHIRFQAVTTGENDGRIVDILSGLHRGDRIVINLDSGIPDGALVRVDTATGKSR